MMNVRFRISRIIEYLKTVENDDRRRDGYGHAAAARAGRFLRSGHGQFVKAFIDGKEVQVPALD